MKYMVSTSLGGGATDHIDGLKDARNDSVNDNLSFGASAFDALTSGANNVAIGNTASSSMTEMQRQQEPNPPSKLATSASVCLKMACSLEAMVISHTT